MVSEEIGGLVRKTVEGSCWICGKAAKLTIGAAKSSIEIVSRCADSAKHLAFLIQKR